jgi:hypothetical protein
MSQYLALSVILFNRTESKENGALEVWGICHSLCEEDREVDSLQDNLQKGWAR